MRRIVLSCLVLLCGAAWAGQMSSHDYTAMQARDSLTGAALAAVKGNEDAYLSGAQGPDTTGVVQYELDTRPASLHRSVGNETHYDPHKAELALNILDAAGKDPARVAYAIGWISHYINDIHVHEVVNNYGGYYKFYARQHKVLEQLESKYVMCEHADIENFTRSHVHYDKLGARFADFIFDAYHTTYPKNPLYDLKAAGWTDAADKRAYFCSRFNEASSWSYSAHDDFYRAATYKDAGGKHRLSGGYVFPDMPSFDDYDHILNAIEITDVKPGKDKLVCTVKVHDDRMYGRFIVDWQAAADKAVAETKAIYPLISDYLAATNAAAKAALRSRLLAAIPKVSLDQPFETKPDSDFQPPTVFPGDQPHRTPAYSCEFRALGGGAPVVANGTAPALTVKATRWEGTEDGETKLEIPVPGGVYPYEFTLKVAIAKKDDFKQSEYYTRSWVQATGSTDTENAGRVMVGEVFPVTITLNSSLAALPGQRVWLMTETYSSNDKTHLNGAIRGANTPFQVQRHSYSILSEFLTAKDDYPVGMITGYDRLHVVEDQKNGNTITAKVQFSGTQPLRYGPQSMLCVFVDHAPYSAKEGTEAFKQWQAASKRAEPVYAIMEKKGESLSEAKKKQLTARAEKYEADLKQQGLSDGEIEKKMQQYYMTMMKELGVTLSKEQQALLDAERAANANQELKSNYYYSAVAKITLTPSRLALQKPEGWKEPENQPFYFRSLSKEINTKGPEDRTLMYASGSIQITAVNSSETETKFLKSHAGKQSVPIVVGPFKGIRFHTGGTEDQGDSVVTAVDDEVLLKCGGFFVQVNARSNARGYRLKNAKNQIIADGVPSAAKSSETLTREIEQMITGFHLIAGQIPGAAK